MSKKEKKTAKPKGGEKEPETAPDSDLPDLFEVVREVGGRQWIIDNVKQLPTGSKDALILVKQFFDQKAAAAQVRRQAAVGGAERRIDELMEQLVSGVKPDEGAAGEVVEESPDEPAGESTVPPESPGPTDVL